VGDVEEEAGKEASKSLREEGEKVRHSPVLFISAVMHRDFFFELRGVSTSPVSFGHAGTQSVMAF
jgi:hypothetical protein